MEFNTNLYVVKATFWDDISDDRIASTETCTILVNGENLASAAMETEAYFGPALIECTIIPLENGPLAISEEVATRLINGD